MDLADRHRTVDEGHGDELPYRMRISALFLATAFSGLTMGSTACLELSLGDDESECTPGEEGCACNEGQCLGELACLSDLCVAPDDTDAPGDSDTTTDDTTTDDTTTDADDTTTDADDCIFNFDCPTTEACVDGTCYDTILLDFDVSVDYFLPISTRCDDGIGDSAVELFYRAYADGVLKYESPYEDCPAEWLNLWPYDSTAILEIEFWEQDILSNDPILPMCWQDEFGDCTPVPPTILHDGFYAGFVDGNEIMISFYPRLR
ncbi:hypothetical protein ACNOYE_36235 [Nannocystaceae bacterium ST9]